jgi:hypothetical protein
MKRVAQVNVLTLVAAMALFETNNLKVDGHEEFPRSRD